MRIRVRPGVKMATVKLIRIKAQQIHGCYQASLVVDLPDVESAPERPECFAAIDLGIINLGVLAFDSGETILYSGKALLDELRQGELHAARCKPSGWTPGKNKLPPSARNKAYRQKAANTSKLAIHNFTTSVIRECAQRGITTLAVGALTGIREDKDFGSAGNQKFHRWPHLEIRRQLKYKGEERGIKVIEISEAYTSQTCSRCGVVHKSNRVERGLYVCKECGLSINADVNGSLNMLRKVSPEATAFGVGGVFPTPPSLAALTPGIGKPSPLIANHPIFVAKFDLRNWSVLIARQVGVER